MLEEKSLVFDELLFYGCSLFGFAHDAERRSSVSALETQMEQEDKVKSIQAEIELMKRDQELEELKFRWKLDSLQRS